MLINQASLEGVFRSFKVLFNKGFINAPTYHELVAMVVSSATRDQQYPWLGNFPGMKEWLGDRQIQALSAFNYTIINKSFESTVEVLREDIEDDNLGIYAPIVTELGRTAKVHKDELVFALLKNGWEEKCYDGKEFFYGGHPVGDFEFSNTADGSGSGWFLMDLSRAVKPLILQVRKKPQFIAKDKATDDNVFFKNRYIYGVDDRKNVGFGLWQLAYGSKQDLTPTNYAAARAAMAGFTKENGQPLGIIPTHLVYGPSNEAAARRILDAEYLDHDSNIWRGTAKHAMIPWL